MPVLHYSDVQILLTDNDVRTLTNGRIDLSKPGFHSLELDERTIHFVAGPGVPFLIEETKTAPDTKYL